MDQATWDQEEIDRSKDIIRFYEERQALKVFDWTVSDRQLCPGCHDDGRIDTTIGNTDAPGTPKRRQDGYKHCERCDVTWYYCENYVEEGESND